MNDLKEQIQMMSEIVSGLTSAIEEQHGYEPGYLKENCTSLYEYPQLILDIPKLEEEVVNDLTTRIEALEAIDHQGLVDNAINEFAADVNNNEFVDTFKELVDYAAEHGSEYSELIGVVENKADKTYVDDRDIVVLSEAKAYIDQEVNRLNISAEANNQTLVSAKAYVDNKDAAMNTRVSALENINHSAYIAADSDTLDAAKEYADNLVSNFEEKGAADTALTNAKTYADTLNSATNVKVVANENAINAINVELDALNGGIGSINDQIDAKINALKLKDTYESKGAANTALNDAKAYADSKDSKMNNRVTALEKIDHSVYVNVNRVQSIENSVSAIQDELESLSGGAGSIDTQISNKIATLDVSDTEVSGQYVSAVKQTDGKISVTRTALPNYANTYDTKGSANSALTSAKAYTDQEINKLSFDASGSAASALSSAKTYADNLNTAMDNRVDALEASKDAYKAADSALEATLKTYVDNHVPDVPITVDSALSSTSTNPVQNKVVTSALASVQIKKETLIITENSSATINLQPNTIYDINLESRKTAVAIKLMGDRSDYHIMSLTFGSTVPTVTMSYDSGYGGIRWLDKYNVLNVLYRDTICQITVFNNCASGGVFAYV